MKLREILSHVHVNLIFPLTLEISFRFYCYEPDAHWFNEPAFRKQDCKNCCHLTWSVRAIAEHIYCRIYTTSTNATVYMFNTHSPFWSAGLPATAILLAGVVSASHTSPFTRLPTAHGASTLSRAWALLPDPLLLPLAPSPPF